MARRYQEPPAQVLSAPPMLMPIANLPRPIGNLGPTNKVTKTMHRSQFPSAFHKEEPQRRADIRTIFETKMSLILIKHNIQIYLSMNHAY